METASTSMEVEESTAPVSLPPGGLFEIIFSFDTTGSMSRVIDEVKGRLQDMIQRLQADIPGIRFGVLAHGDYCDKDVFYLEKHIDLTRDIKQLCDFVSDIEGTGGGDPEECYELVLNLAGKFSWTPGSQRALVMIGDSEPHTAEYDLNTENLDWREEAKALAAMGIKVYGVQAFENEESTKFFEELTELTSGQHLKLGDFSHICDFIMAICYREKGEEFLEGYEAEVRAREARKAALHPDLEGLFVVLRRGDSSASRTGSLIKETSTGSLTKTASVSSAMSGIPPAPTIPRMISSLSSVSSLPVTSSGSPAPTAVVHPVVATKKTAPKHSPVVCKIPPKQLHHFKKKSVAKTSRHTVSDKKFILKKKNFSKRWSTWKVAVQPSEPTTRQLSQWTPCRIFREKVGYLKTEPFKRECRYARLLHALVLHEVAVQTSKHGKKHVMYYRWDRTNSNPATWFKRFFKKAIIKKQVSDALKADCKIYVRRCLLNRLGKTQETLVKKYRKTYSYAWKDRTRVVRNKVVISS